MDQEHCITSSIPFSVVSETVMPDSEDPSDHLSNGPWIDWHDHNSNKHRDVMYEDEAMDQMSFLNDRHKDMTHMPTGSPVTMQTPIKTGLDASPCPTGHLQVPSISRATGSEPGNQALAPAD